MSELRWNPLLEEWVVTATHRQERTFLPPQDYCPLCPTRAGSTATEIPAGDYEIAVFENRFPTFQRHPPEPAVEGSELCPVRPAQGVCEVVLYTSQHEGSLGELPVEHIRKLIAVWADRWLELGALPYVQYVQIFENRGREIGVTLTHPHGQIYAFPFIPPVLERELAACRRHQRVSKHCLLCDILAAERREGTRVVRENVGFTAFVPFFARYPHEVHIVSRVHRTSIAELGDDECWDLAALLKDTVCRFDALYGFPLPYMMVMHQRPSDGKRYPYYHFHIEFYTLHRTADKLKYRASSESGAGVFSTDELPEQWAAELRAAGA
ncbi:MAG: galactose-1-phosphate uridylyltransferase [Chloroflexi bacterium]|nr:galactose-1-phosphate uridylyltransferase [Chloroflexota bacterium]